MVVFALVLLAFHNHQGIHVVTNSAGFPVNGSSFLAAMFMSLFVIYGFDTASTLSEETKDPRRAAPKAVLGSVIGAFIIGGMFLLAALVAIPNLGAAVKNAWWTRAGHRRQLLHRLRDPLPVRGLRGDLRLLPVDHGRDDQALLRDGARQPAAGLQAAGPGLAQPAHPGVECIVISCCPAVPFIQYAGVAIIAIAATGMIYLSYFLGNLVIMRARARGWPKTSAPFRLGRWGLLVNVVALLYGGAMLVNFAWPRAASNPKPNQTGGACLDLNRLPQRHPDPVDGGGLHRAGRGHLLPGRRAEEGLPAGDRAVRDDPLPGEAGGDRARGLARQHGPAAGGSPCRHSRGPGAAASAPRCGPAPGSRRRSCAGRVPPCTGRSRTGWPARSPPARWCPATGCPPSTTWPRGSASAG